MRLRSRLRAASRSSSRPSRHLLPHGSPRRSTVPTIGIGAGLHCDGQVLVWHDLLGLYEGHAPRFVKQYADLAEVIKAAVGTYVDEVRERRFPEEQHTYSMPEEELARFEEALQEGAEARKRG